ncbi:lytic transglycosylase domain-containing protein [Burkholderia cepacia]|uniref:lytic transglycosylase domain-containing protein n=1 Tax=Burkholderia cepacia TaxID=292 RepID=UPI002FDFED64
MADDLDRFVLSYTVELKDSISRLEKLQEKQNAVQKTAKDTGSEFRKFGADAAGELGKLVPGLNAVSTAVRAMGGEFAAATVAIGALALGVKAVMDLREQYNQQRTVGMQLGVSGTRLENYQRAFVRSGGSRNMSRDAAVQGITAFSDMANAAYIDPTRIGREARIMRMLGVDVGERGQQPTGTNERLTQLAKALQGKSAGSVQGIAKATGMNQDWLLTLQQIGPQIGKITELTSTEIETRGQAEQGLARFNDQLGQLKENFTEVSNALAEPLLPALTQLVQLMKELASVIPKSDNSKEAKAVKDYVADKRSGPAMFLDLIKDKFGIGQGGDVIDKNSFMKNGGLLGALGLLGDDGKKNAAEQQQAKQAAQKADDKRDEAVDKMDEANKQGLKTANQMSLAINMFSGAVHAFSSAIDEQQAWAAWAGEIGKANNLPGSNSAALTGGGNGSWKSNQYADLIAASAKKYGMDPQMIAAIMHVESSGKNGQYSSTGAGGLMQVTRGNWKAYGNGRDVMDPAANIDVGTRIYAENYRKFHGNAIAALNAYNGNSDPNYVAKINKAYGAGGGINGIAPNSRAGMNVVSVQKAVASWLGVPVEQVQQGGVSRSDAAWAAKQMTAGIQNNVTGIQRQLSTAGLPAQTYANLATELRNQSRGLELMKMYSQGVVDKQNQDSGRVRTRGEQPITVNAQFTINGATDPHAVGQAVNDHLRQAMNELMVHYADGDKG